MSFRSRVVQLARTLAEAQIHERTPEYYAITEGREDWTKPDGSVGYYAWCGDFATYVLTRCGATERECLNRKETRGTWTPGKNISMLIECARARGAAYAGSAAYSRLQQDQRGDIIVLENATGGHVGFLARTINGRVYETYDGNTYGGRTGINIRDVSVHRIAWVLDVDCFHVGEVLVGDTEPPVKPPLPQTGPNPVGAEAPADRRIDPAAIMGDLIGAALVFDESDPSFYVFDDSHYDETGRNVS